MRIAIVAVAFVMLAGSARAEVPPHIEWTVPADGATNVPTNAQIWLYGETLSDGHAAAQLAVADTGSAVAVTVRRLQAIDYSRINRDDDRSGGWVGPSQRRYLIVVTPRAALTPNTRYTVTYDIEGSESFSFTTGAGPDTTPPTLTDPTAVRHHVGGAGENGPRNFTLVDLVPPTDDSGFPVRVDFHTGASLDVANFVGFLLERDVPPTLGVLRGHEPRCVFAQAVDIAGNMSPMSACVQPD